MVWKQDEDVILFPAIDIMGGQCVRLEQGRADRKTVYFDDPLEPATLWKEAGASWLHVVDLDGAFTGEPQNLETVGRIARETGLLVQLGGGMRDEAMEQRGLDAGAARLVVGTRACQEPAFAEKLAREFGDRVAIGIDAKDGRVAISGWVETSDMDALDFARRVSRFGIQRVIYTDISTDGMLTGPNLSAQEAMAQAADLQVIASGGVSKADDIEALASLARQCPNLEGVIVGKALYEKRIDLAAVLPRASGA